jgi:predicted nucleic-acid-binding Zn-ribbon protein
MRDGICPKCGSKKVFSRTQNAGAYTGNSIPLGGMRYLPLDNYVCVACGYVEFYLSYAKGMQSIARQWQRVGKERGGPVFTTRVRLIGRRKRLGPLQPDLFER